MRAKILFLSFDMSTALAVWAKDTDKISYSSEDSEMSSSWFTFLRLGFCEHFLLNSREILKYFAAK